MREFKLNDVIFEVIVKAGGIGRGAEGSQPGSSAPLPARAEGEGVGEEGKITLNDDTLPWSILQSAVQSPARECTFF